MRGERLPCPEPLPEWWWFFWGICGWAFDYTPDEFARLENFQPSGRWQPNPPAPYSNIPAPAAATAGGG